MNPSITMITLSQNTKIPSHILYNWGFIIEPENKDLGSSKKIPRENEFYNWLNTTT